MSQTVFLDTAGNISVRIKELYGDNNSRKILFPYWRSKQNPQSGALCYQILGNGIPINQTGPNKVVPTALPEKRRAGIINNQKSSLFTAFYNRWSQKTAGKNAAGKRTGNKNHRKRKAASYQTGIAANQKYDELI
jgi:hypothetical protein